jgi:hypothetical protein
MPDNEDVVSAVKFTIAATQEITRKNFLAVLTFRVSSIMGGEGSQIAWLPWQGVGAGVVCPLPRPIYLKPL